MLKILSMAMALVLIGNYLFITHGILKKGHDRNPLTWILWTGLDCIALCGIIRRHDDTTMIWVFTLGTLLVAVAALIKNTMRFEFVEKLVCFLFVGCVGIFIFGSPDVFIWTLGCALFTAGVPYLHDLYRARSIGKYIKIEALLFLAAMSLSVCVALASKSSLIIPSMCLVYWGIATALIFSKKRKRAFY